MCCLRQCVRGSRSLQSNLGEGRTPHVPDISEISRDLQIQTAINVKQVHVLMHLLSLVLLLNFLKG